MNGFTYDGHHFTWDEATGYYWNDDMRGAWYSFRPCAVPRKAVWDDRGGAR